MRWLALTIAISVSNAAAASAQSHLLSNVDVMLGAHDVLHTADMITTTYDLTHGQALGASERNPILKPFGSRPALLTGVSGAFDVLQVAVIKQVERTHPRWALVWAGALVAIEVWATTNNIAAAGRIQQRNLLAAHR